MDELVEKIVRVLLQRQNQSLFISCDKFYVQERTVKDFTHHQKIHLTHVGVIQLAKISRLDDTDPITTWLLKGIEFGCEIVLHLCFSSVYLIPNVLYEWPITLENNQGKRLRVSSQQVITYSDVALLKKSDILVRFSHQQITSLAEEHLMRNKIQQIVRGQLC